MFGDRASAFWFYGTLAPIAGFPGFFAQEIVVSEKVRIEIALEQLGVWSRPGTTEYKQPGEVMRLARLVAGLWSLVAGRPLDWSLTGWIEATEADVGGSVMGVLDYRNVGGLTEGAPESQEIRAAADIAVQLVGRADFRLAIADIQAALRESSEDAALFAYRAVECAARALTGASGEVNGAIWEKFHRLLGRDPVDGKELMDPLTRARGRVAHGEIDSMNPFSEAERNRLILIGRRLIVEALEADAAIQIDTELHLRT